jgi:hypothetical protein
VCLVDFRARLVKAGVAGFLKDQMLLVAKHAGAIGQRPVVDSTGLGDSVVTQDTVTLIHSAARVCLEWLTAIDPVAANTLAGSLLCDARIMTSPANRRPCGLVDVQVIHRGGGVLFK